MYRAGDTLAVEFITAGSTGVAVNADSLPTAILTRNGVDDGTSVTVSNLDAGRYKATCVIPSGWVPGDAIGVVAVATVATVVKKAVAFQDVLTYAAADIVATLLATAVPATNTPGTVADALNGARAQAFGKWALSGTSLVLYGPDDVTPVKTFTLNSATSPTTRQ